MSLFITGDKHGEIGIRDLALANFAEGRYLEKTDYVVVLGDFGLLWSNPPSDEEKYWLRWLSSRNWTTLFVDGNHENFDVVDSLPETDFLGGKAGFVADNIFHLKRGEIYDIEGKKCFAFGGASSPDKERRKEGVSWWKREMPSLEEMNKGLDNLEKHNFKIDYIFTHSAPTRVLHLLKDQYVFDNMENKPVDFLNEYFDYIAAVADFDKWFFGHYHLDTPEIIAPHSKGVFSCQYNNVYPVVLDDRTLQKIKTESIEGNNLNR